MLKGDLCISLVLVNTKYIGLCYSIYHLASSWWLLSPCGLITSSLEVQALPDTIQRPEMGAISDIVRESFDKNDHSCLIEKINKKRMKKGNVIFPFKVF